MTDLTFKIWLTAIVIASGAVVAYLLISGTM